jgi:hypothetical protein
MEKIFDITEVRARQVKLAKIKEVLGELAHRIAIPPENIPEEEVGELPVSFLRKIEDLTLNELDALLNGSMKFCILKRNHPGET